MAQKRDHFRRMQLALSRETFQPWPSIHYVLLKYPLAFNVGSPYYAHTHNGLSDLCVNP